MAKVNPESLVDAIDAIRLANLTLFKSEVPPMRSRREQKEDEDHDPVMWFPKSAYTDLTIVSRDGSKFHTCRFLVDNTSNVLSALLEENPEELYLDYDALDIEKWLLAFHPTSGDSVALDIYDVAIVMEMAFKYDMPTLLEYCEQVVSDHKSFTTAISNELALSILKNEHYRGMTRYLGKWICYGDLSEEVVSQIPRWFMFDVIRNPAKYGICC
jgi:hypothetical protein